MCVVIFYFSYSSIDKISLITLYMGALFFQYLYWLCILDTQIPNSIAVQKCMKCNSMTPQHYVHCDLCKKCQNPNLDHFMIVGTCVRKSNYKRYILFLRALIGLIGILTILQCILHTLLSIVLVFVHIYVLKSTYNTDSRNIYVT